MTTGERIKEARKRAGMTQKELADKLGVQFQNISSLERDERNPKIETVVRIAMILGVDPRDLLEVDLTSGVQTGLNPSRAEEFKIIRDQNKQRISEALDKMSSQGQQIALKIVKDLSEVPALQKEPPPQADAQDGEEE